MRKNSAYFNATLVVPTRSGRDLDSNDGTRDAHIRIERYKEVSTDIYVDIFDSTVKDPNKAHKVSETFPWTDEGADQATRFLQKQGFRTAVMIK